MGISVTGITDIPISVLHWAQHELPALYLTPQELHSASFGFRWPGVGLFPFPPTPHTTLVLPSVCWKLLQKLHTSYARRCF